MDFTKLTAYVDSLPSLGVPGCDMAVYQDHRQLYRHSAGSRDAAKTQPVRPDDTYWLFSCTKLFTTCAAMQLIGQGKINLDDPVSDYLPAYAQMAVKDGAKTRPAKRAMTIRHLMSMQSGLNYNLEAPAILQCLKETGRMASTRQIVDALAKEPLEFDPGEDFLYSLSHDVLAAVIEAVSGKKFSEYLEENIFAPLGLGTLSFTLTPELKGRQAVQVMHREDGTFSPMDPEDNCFRFTPNYESGGAGLIGDVHDLIVFLDAIACGGVSADGKRLLSPEMIQLWSANQLGPQARLSFDGWNRKGYSYGLGVRTRVTALPLGGRGQMGEFGWDGAACSWAMIDPVNRLSAFFAMHVRSFGYAYDVIHPTLRDLIYLGLE
ncbi:MAG: beta-lactamase family protein [Clostridia bacterium]|nr:beta-lactamase family protein [Clostridia bacterium]